MLYLTHIDEIFSPILMILYCITVIGLAMVVITENRNPVKTIAWVLVFTLLPGIGLIFYFFFGQDNRKQKAIYRRTYKRIMDVAKGPEIPQDPCQVPISYRSLSTLINYSENSPMLYGTEIQILTDGRSKFDSVLHELSRAKHHIHIESYVWEDDEIGTKIKQVLMEKAREGIEVRVIYDDVGSWTTKRSFFNEMKTVGIQIHAFLRVAFPYLTNKVNYRNHRKIIVIDGKVGFFGGMNIADRYVKGVSWGNWRDTHFKLKGRGVHGLQSVFLLDWYATSKEEITAQAYFPDMPVYTKTILQFVVSGPTLRWRILQQAALMLIAKAEKYIYIQTPYFMPTEGLNQVLLSAALGGIDVRLMIPEKADVVMAHLATSSYLDVMVKAGVRIFFYQKGFLHAKSLIVDDRVSCIGSANFDFRSFEHNFEVNAFVYQEDFTKQMREIFEADQKDCREIEKEVWLQRPKIRRVKESVMRLFSPLL